MGEIVSYRKLVKVSKWKFRSTSYRSSLIRIFKVKSGVKNLNQNVFIILKHIRYYIISL